MKADNIIKNMKKINSIFTSMSNIKANSKDKERDIIAPPKRPS